MVWGLFWAAGMSCCISSHRVSHCFRSVSVPANWMGGRVVGVCAVPLVLLGMMFCPMLVCLFVAGFSVLL